jgi:hypothetical protein
MATHFVQAGPHTTLSVSSAGRHVLMEVACGDTKSAFLTPKEARELAVRLKGVADAVEPPEPPEYD